MKLGYDDNSVQHHTAISTVQELVQYDNLCSAIRWSLQVGMTRPWDMYIETDHLLLLPIQQSRFHVDSYALWTGPEFDSVFGFEEPVSGLDEGRGWRQLPW